MLSDITAIIAASTAGAKFLKVSADAGKSFKDFINTPEPDVIAMKQALLELQEALFDAKNAQVSVQNQLLDLQQKLQKRDRFAAQAARYELTQTDMGGRVYTLKKDDNTGEPPHEICATCFEDAIKSILQPSNHNTLLCYRCNTKVFKSDGRSGAMSVSVKHNRFDGF